mmetsp:Transcript_21404/g.46955  ORF Transcript_21404/g.46955 Transcript_21404/m.46955 type:complete len:348 (-) Transcript_21404:929-1972(-)
MPHVNGERFQLCLSGLAAAYVGYDHVSNQMRVRFLACEAEASGGEEAVYGVSGHLRAVLAGEDELVIGGESPPPLLQPLVQHLRDVPRDHHWRALPVHSSSLVVLRAVADDPTAALLDEGPPHLQLPQGALPVRDPGQDVEQQVRLHAPRLCRFRAAPPGAGAWGALQLEVMAGLEELGPLEPLALHVSHRPRHPHGRLGVVGQCPQAVDCLDVLIGPVSFAGPGLRLAPVLKLRNLDYDAHDGELGGGRHLALARQPLQVRERHLHALLLGGGHHLLESQRLQRDPLCVVQPPQHLPRDDEILRGGVRSHPRLLLPREPHSEEPSEVIELLLQARWHVLLPQTVRG